MKSRLRVDAVRKSSSDFLDEVAAPKREWPFALLALLLAFLGMLSFPFSFNLNQPSNLWPTFFLAFVPPLIGVGYSFYRSSKSSFRWRWFYGPLILFGLFFCSIPLFQFLSARGDFPWLVFAPVLGAVLAAAACCHHRWMLVALPATLLWAVGGGVLPASARYPISRSSQGIKVTLFGWQGNRLLFTVAKDRSLDGFEIRPQDVRVWAKIGRLGRLHRASARQLPGESYFSSFIQAPAWARNASVDFAVLARPVKFWPFVFIYRDGTKTPKIFTSKAGSPSITATEVDWTDPSTVKFVLTATGLDHPGFDYSQVRVNSDRGATYELQTGEVTGTESGFKLTGEVTGLPPGTKSIRIQVFAPPNGRGGIVDFHFSGLPLAG